MEKEKGGFLNLTKVHEEEDMRVFRLQVAELKKMEKEDGEPNLKECNPDELDEKDKEIYGKFLLGDDKVMEELEDYRDETAKNGNISLKENISQKEFIAYLINKLMVRNIEEEEEEKNYE